MLRRTTLLPSHEHPHSTHIMDPNPAIQHQALQGIAAMICQALENTDLSHQVQIGAAYMQLEPTGSRKKEAGKIEPLTVKLCSSFYGPFLEGVLFFLSFVLSPFAYHHSYPQETTVGR